MSDYAGTDHRLTVTIENEGALRFSIECNAPEGAQCRLTCDDGCEEFTFEGHVHPLVDSGECMPMVYLDNAGESIQEYYDGPIAPLVDGIVSLRYHGGDQYVTWHYFGAAANL